MSDNVQLQAGIENLSLQGLNGFTTILAAISVDNITPIALLQMENFGAAFHVSGRYAEQTKSLLQRCNDRRFDNLALLVGWRKNDSASLMAQSAGGQAISLLSLCLSNMFSFETVGDFLGQLCLKLLPASDNIASFSQLAQVAEILAAKLNTMGFGNHLAKVVTKVHDTYFALGMTAPPSLLTQIDPSFTAGMLSDISETLRQDDRICRIWGSCGMGYYLALILALFPNDTSVKVDNVFIQDVENAKIQCHIDRNDAPGIVHVHVDCLLSNERPISSLIDRNVRDLIEVGPRLCFHWQGWVATLLELSFLEFSVECNEDVLRACCNFLVLLPEVLYVSRSVNSAFLQGETGSTTRLIDLLGPFPRAHMSQVCETLLLVKPTGSCEGLEKALDMLVASFKDATHYSGCECDKENIWNKGWDFYALALYQICKACRLWYYLGLCLEFGLYSLFVKAQSDVSIRNCKTMSSKARSLNLISTALGNRQNFEVNAGELIDCISTIVRSPATSDVMISDGSTTIYPSILETLQMPLFQSIGFSLVDGTILHQNRHYEAVKSTGGDLGRSTRKKATSSNLVPSGIGVPMSGVLLSIRQACGSLELQCFIKYDGIESDVSLLRIIKGYIGLEWTRPCPHPSDDAMDCIKYPALATSVALPTVKDGIGVVMTRHHPMAQLLSCGAYHFSVLLKDCCLNCAAESADGHPRGQIAIIVS